MSLARHKATRSAFTLVELLVVITIIGLLAGLLTVGLYAAFGTGKNFVIANEINQVSMTLEDFKRKNGVYPPDMQSPVGFNTFVNKAYPRADRTAIVAFQNLLSANSKVIDPAEALVLYLAYTSKDPRVPFRFASQMAADTGSPPIVWTNPTNDLEVFYKFPAGSLKDADLDGFPEFIQKNARGAPLVYFDARSYTQVVPGTNPPQQVAKNVQIGFVNSGYSGATGVATPCASGLDNFTNYVFFNRDSYQLISAGQNGEFGVVLGATPSYPIINAAATTLLPRVTESDGDNIANFTSGKTFDAALAQ